MTGSIKTHPATNCGGWSCHEWKAVDPGCYPWIKHLEPNYAVPSGKILAVQARSNWVDVYTEGQALPATTFDRGKLVSPGGCVVFYLFKDGIDRKTGESYHLIHRRFYVFNDNGVARFKSELCPVNIAPGTFFNF